MWTKAENEKLRLHIRPGDTLPYVGVLPEGKIKTVYLTFTVDKANLCDWTWLKVRFVEYSGYTQDLVIEMNKIKPEQIIWDDRIWGKISS
jgi:hypothetical protein